MSEQRAKSPATELRQAQKVYDNAHHRWCHASANLAYAKRRLEQARFAVRQTK
jgi:hypothetical protein